MSISNFKLNSTAQVFLVSPIDGSDLLNEDGNQMTVTISGPHTKEFKALNRKLLIERESGYSDKDYSELSIQEKIDRKERIDLDDKTLVAGVITAFNLEDESGPIKFSSKKALSLVLDPDTDFIGIQVSEAVQAGKLFYKNQKKT